MLNMRDEDIEFIKKYIGEDSFLLTTDDVGEFSDFLAAWIAEFGFKEDSYDINDLGRAAEHAIDYVCYNN